MSGVLEGRWGARCCDVSLKLLLGLAAAIFFVCSTACFSQTPDQSKSLEEQSGKAQAFMNSLIWSNWTRLPTDSEIAEAKDAALKAIARDDTEVTDEGEISEMRHTTTITVTSSEATKVHRTDIKEPLASNGVILRVTAHYMSKTEYPNSALYRNKPTIGEDDEYHALTLQCDKGKWSFSSGKVGRTSDEAEDYVRDQWSSPASGWLPVTDAKTPNTPDQPKTPWTVVVGGVAAVSAAAAAAVAAAKAKGLGTLKTGQPNSEHPNQPPKPLQYILQLSAKKISLNPGKPAQLSVKAWKVGADGAFQPAPEAAIKLSVAPGVQGVSVSPDSGSGEVVCAISVAGDPSATQGKLHVVATAGGSQIGDSVDLDLAQAFELEFF